MEKHFLLKMRKNVDLLKWAYPDHPLIRRIREGSIPTFLVGDMPPDTHLPENVSQAFTFVVRTTYLDKERLKEAIKTVIGVDVSEDQVKDLADKLSIGDVVSVNKQLKHLGMTDDVERVLERPFLVDLKS